MHTKGVTTIEIIVAFLFFVGITTFALIFFNPLDNNRVLDTTLVYSVDEIVSNVSVPVIEYEAVFFNSVPYAEILITLENPEEYDVRVEDREGVRYNAQYVEARGGVLISTTSGSDNNRFYTMRFSEVFEQNNFPNGGRDVEGSYELFGPETYLYVSEERVEELRDYYYDNYLALKESFNLPGRVDFGFSLEFGNGDAIVAERPIPSDIEDIFTDTQPIHIIREDGTMVSANMSVQTW